ncbi:MAG: metallophosphoesterase [Candidatus Doudnabacteria bacterium]|nr:metallophosphoesterase [Candidatus Doudnabacteria bacterium]
MKRRFAFSTVVIAALLLAVLGIRYKLQQAEEELLAESSITLPSLERAEERSATSGAVFSLGVVSDTERSSGGISDTFRAIEEDMRSKGLTTALHLGDGAHRANKEDLAAWSTFVTESSLTWFIVPGNHDLLQPHSASGRDYTTQPFLQTFGALSSVERPHEDLVIIRLNNADNTIGFPEQDRILLEDTLDEVAAEPSPPTVLIAMHRPVQVPLADAYGLSDGTAGAADESYDQFVRVLEGAPRNLTIQIVAGHVHSTFGYELAGYPVLVTGGGGSASNTTGLLPSFPHWYLLALQEDGSFETLLQRIE